MKNAAIPLLFAILLGSSRAPQQPTNGSLAGVWTLITVENVETNGNRTLPYGDSPSGQLILEANGDYSIQILAAERPKIAANDRTQGTPDENAALVKGSNSHFGTYTIDTVTHHLTFHIEHAFYRNWEGTVQDRSYTLENNILRYVIAHPSSGSSSTTAVAVWRRELPSRRH